MQGKYASSTDWSDLESVTTTSDSVDGLDRRNNPGSRHLTSPTKKRNPIVNVSSDNNRFLAPPLRQAPSKASLLSRFLRSITERKFDFQKDKKNISKPNSLYIKGGKVDQKMVKEFDKELDKEIQENLVLKKRESSGEKICLRMKEVFRRNIYRDKSEELYKVYKVRGSYMTNGESKPMLALLTDKTLYLTGEKADHTYSNQFVIPYNELDVIMVNILIFFFSHNIF